MKIIKTVGVIGAGTMGAALAQKFAQENFKVILADREMQFVERGLNAINSMLQQGVEKKIFTQESMQQILANIKGSVDLQELKSCDLIVEAIFEDFKAKADLFKSLSKIVNPDTIIATNTSSFSVDELAEHVTKPERFIGLHYFYHAAKNRLVEIIPGAKTSPETFEAAKIFSMMSGKDAITCSDAYGFVVNRFFVPWLNEAVRILDEDIAGIATIDDVAMNALGIAMGPFALMNATGVPVAYHAEKTLEVFGPLYTVSERLKLQAEAKQLWNLNGEISDDEAIRKSIAERLTGIVFFICAQLLDEKVCTATEINRGARIGLKWKRGPVELMALSGFENVKRLMLTVSYRYKIDLPKSTAPEQWKMDFVDYEKKNNVAVITINRPEDLNALNETVIKNLEEKFAIAEQDNNIKSIIIKGAGKAFVAGADISFFVRNMKQRNIVNIETFTAYGQKVFERIDNSRKKVIAILNGLALGGGLELALCADVIVALPNAQLAFPETGIGIYPGLGGTFRSVRKIGRGLSKFLIHTGKIISANDAFEMSLIDKIISAEEMVGLESGQIDINTGNTAITERWKNIKHFFEKNSLDNILKKQFAGNGIAIEEALKYASIIQNKAPVALRLADKLIDESKSCDEELKHLNKVFATEDALLGLTNIGKKVSYSGK